jgi:hypothetical protein
MRKSLYSNPAVARVPPRDATSRSIVGGMSRKPGGEVKVAAA